MVGQSDFREKVDALTPEDRAILSRRINELSLKIPGTRLELFINKLYQELSAKGILFRPKCYLSDDWGCPQGIPVIGIPFYLADNRLSQLEGQLTGIEAENDEEIMMFLRHEAGHAFNYAYKLYHEPEWKSVFGTFTRPYRENFKPRPFAASFVRHLPGWYAQKHPDEDFAETFAVWLTPSANWEEKYRDTRALTKLLYIRRIVEEYGNKLPIVTEESLDKPVEELSDTLIDWYDTSDYEYPVVNLPVIINEDLRRLFSFSGQPQQPLFQFISRESIKLIQYLHEGTGLERELIEVLVSEIISRCQKLNLVVETDKDKETMTKLTIFFTTLIINYLYTENFVKL